MKEKKEKRRLMNNLSSMLISTSTNKSDFLPLPPPQNTSVNCRKQFRGCSLFDNSMHKEIHNKR